MKSRPQAVILNDTSTRYHHGCSRVMRLLVQGLEQVGLQVSARSPARNDWAHDDAFLSALRQADVIVINGEGTLHHGAEAGARLLSIADHPDRGQTPIALINALYQDNPEAWGVQLSKCALLAARDSASARALSQASGKDARWLPDLSLSAPAEIAHSGSPHGILVGDSVKFSARQVLARYAAQLPKHGTVFVPTKTLSGKVWGLPVVGTLAHRLLYRLYMGYFGARVPAFHMAAGERAYLGDISRAELHVTGRFHAICLSMLTETPFLAVTSNASKIERLLSDSGLNNSRILSPAQLLETQENPDAYQFTAAELNQIRQFRQLAQAQSVQMFNDIRALVD